MSTGSSMTNMSFSNHFAIVITVDPVCTSTRVFVVGSSTQVLCQLLVPYWLLCQIINRIVKLNAVEQCHTLDSMYTFSHAARFSIITLARCEIMAVARGILWPLTDIIRTNFSAVSGSFPTLALFQAMQRAHVNAAAKTDDV